MTVQVNLTAALELTSALDASNSLTNDARVVLLSSINGIAGAAGQTNYAASKAGLMAAASQLSTEWSASGISRAANAIAPGFIETDMTAAVPPMVGGSAVEWLLCIPALLFCVYAVLAST